MERRTKRVCQGNCVKAPLSESCRQSAFILSCGVEGHRSFIRLPGYMVHSDCCKRLVPRIRYFQLPAYMKIEVALLRAFTASPLHIGFEEGNIHGLLQAL